MLVGSDGLTIDKEGKLSVLKFPVCYHVKSVPKQRSMGGTVVVFVM